MLIWCFLDGEPKIEPYQTLTNDIGAIELAAIINIKESGYDTSVIKQNSINSQENFNVPGTAKNKSTIAIKESPKFGVVCIIPTTSTVCLDW